MLLEHREVAAYALADPLKAGCQALFGLTDEETWSDDLKEKTIQIWGESPRQMFQRVGTEWLRDHNPDHWLLRADRQLNHPLPPSLPARPEDLTSPSASIWLAAQVIWGLSYEQTWQSDSRDQVDEFWALTPNQMLSAVETYLYRDIQNYPDIRTKRPIKQPTSRSLDTTGKSVFIIKDIRYENEAAFWRSHNGVIWHIVRNNALKVNPHSSEMGINFEPGDFLIENNDTLEELRIKIDHAWKSVRPN